MNRFPTLLMNKTLITGITVLSLIALGCGGSGSAKDGSSGDSVTPPNDATVPMDAGDSTTGDQTNPGDSTAPDSTATDGGVEDGTTTNDTTEGDISAQDLSTPSDSTTTEEIEFNDLFITIIGPTGRPYGMSLSSVVPVSGLMFGDAVSITWTKGNDSGEIEPGRYWSSGPINLTPGDNTIVVTATAADGEVSSDSIMITYNPSFQFDDYVSVRPGQIFSNRTTKLITSVPLGFYTNYNDSTVELHQCDAEGNIITTLGPMVDNGEVNSDCDEIQGDGVFSRCVTMTPSENGHLYFRSSVSVDTGVSTYTAYSPVTVIDVVDAVPVSTCENVVSLNNSIYDAYANAINTGSSASEAQEAALAFAQTNGAVDQAGLSPNGYGIWIRHTSGLLGAIDLSPDNLRSGGGAGTVSGGVGNQKILGSRRAMIFAPYRSDLGDQDESAGIKTLLNDSGCPAFSVTEAKDGNATLKKLRDLYEYGVVVLSTHGEVFFDGIDPQSAEEYGWEHEGAQEVLWTGEAINCNNLSDQNSSCQADSQCPTGASCVITSASGNNISGLCVDFRHGDLRNGRAVIGTNRYGILPNFITRYTKRDYPNS